MNSAIDRILTAMPEAKKTNSGWEARCPGHEDRRASLSIGVGDDGRVLLHCHAGCETSAIVGKIGLTMKDLMPSINGNGAKIGKPRIVATYDYRDTDGTLLSQACRTDPKGFFQRAPKPGGGWINSVKNVRRVPYKLPELLAADPAKTVFIVEGEKDTDRLWCLGLIATTNAGGAEKWPKNFALYFSGRSVVILPDNDTPGRKHAHDVAIKLHSAAASIKIIELAGLPEKGDVSDWLNAGHSVDELSALVDSAIEWQPSTAQTPTPTPQDHSPCPLHEIGFIKAVKYGRQGASYDFIFNCDGEELTVHFDSLKQLRSFTQAKNDIWETTDHDISNLKGINKITWEKTMMQIVGQAERKDASSETEMVEDYLRDYLKAKKVGGTQYDPMLILLGGTKEENQLTRKVQSFVAKDGALHLKLSDLQQWLSTNCFTVRSKSLTQALSRLGFVPRTIQGRDTDGQKKLQRYWVSESWQALSGGTYSDEREV